PVRGHDGSGQGTVWVARDMRPHLMMLAEVEAARDAALEVSRLKSEFLANMSHEMRTPMNAVIGYTDIALETDLAAEQREYLAAVKRAAVGLLAVVNDVLDVARIEGGKLALDRVAFKLRETVRDVLKTLALRADEKGLELASDVGTEVPDGVVGDPNRLRQVLVNLVGNAVKFTETGEVVVRVRLESYVADRAALLRFAVADTGIGIPADKQGLIFHAFAQADGSMSRTYGGTGRGRWSRSPRRMVRRGWRRSGGRGGQGRRTRSCSSTRACPRRTASAWPSASSRIRSSVGRASFSSPPRPGPAMSPARASSAWRAASSSRSCRPICSTA